MAYVGIDYGSGRTNIDNANGIRFGVISQHSVMQAWCESSEGQYGDPTCPKCGAEGIVPLTELSDDVDADEFEQYGGGCADYACQHCEITLDNMDAFSDEPQGFTYSGDGYELIDCLDSDIMILKSPFYTFAPFCSPCVPGAGNLDSADGRDSASEDCLPQTYCLGHDWFEEGKAPYKVFRVGTGEVVLPE